MDFRGMIKVLMLIFAFGCAVYVACLILSGINNSIKDIPWWMAFVIMFGGIYFYDTYKENRGK